LQDEHNLSVFLALEAVACSSGWSLRACKYTPDAMMSTPIAKDAEPMARMVSIWLSPNNARKQMIPITAKTDPMAMTILGMVVVVRPVYHKLSLRNHPSSGSSGVIGRNTRVGADFRRGRSPA
jgi:hypothetical protein